MWILLFMYKVAPVLVIGLNAAHQKTIQLPNLKKGAVNRGSQVAFHAGGKGQHCAVACNVYCGKTGCWAPVLLQKTSEAGSLMLVAGVGTATLCQFLGQRGEAGECHANSIYT